MKRPDPQKDADAFNKEHPVGTLVNYWGMEKKGPPSGTGKIKHLATVLSGHTAVAWIEGARGCYAVTHVEKAVTP